MMPILSIIIPVYNVESFIGECLDSICSQIENKEDVEVIVINDGTKDQSMQIVHEYARRYGYITCYNQGNKGLSATRNRGIGLSSGNYIWFVDSDDWLIHDSLIGLLNTIKAYSETEIFVTPLTYIRDGIIEKTDIPNNRYSYLTGKEYVKEGLPTGASQRFIIKRSVLTDRQIRFIEGILHEDGPFGYMLMWNAGNIMVLSKSIYNYRQRETSIMHSIKIRSSYDLIQGYRYLMRFMEKNIPEDEHKAFRVMCSKLLYSSYTFVKPIWETSEFSIFETENKKYICREVGKTIESLTGTKKIYAWAFSYSPRTTLKVFDLFAKVKLYFNYG